MKWMPTALVSVCAAVLVAVVAFARPDGAEAQVPLPQISSGQQPLADVAERVVPSVVNISAERVVKAPRGPFFNDPFFREFSVPPGMDRDRKSSSLGSGVIVDGKGIILTNNHVVDGADELRVSLSDGREFDAELVGSDPDTDLAVVKLKGKVRGLTPVPFGSSEELRLGEMVLAVGNPFGVGQTVTMGIVSAKGRSVGIVRGGYEDFIQTDAAINPGNSGGALINMKGELVGINTAILSRSGGYQGIGFAIPTTMAQPIMQSLLKDGTVARGYLGVQIQDIDRSLARAMNLGDKRGVLIADVRPGTPADRGGLRNEDLVTHINGKRVKSTTRLRNTIAATAPGSTVSLDIIRRGRKKTVRVKLGELPTERKPLAKAEKKPDDYFGVQLSPVDDRFRQSYRIAESVNGIGVVRVVPGSKADKAGVRRGDVIMEVSGKRVNSAESFKKAYKSARGTALLRVHRGGGVVYLAIK